MGGGDLNLKKSWHPNTLKNQKRVYEAEQANAAEKRKLKELQSEIEHERNFEELKRIGQNSGVLAADDSNRLEWMYKGAETSMNREEYLTGRAIDKHFEQQDKIERQKDTSNLIGVTVPKNHVEHECIPFSIRSFRGAPVSEEQVDLQRKILEDPLMMIQQREMETRQKILQNPVKLKEIHRLLEADKKLKESSSHKKKKKSKTSKKSKKQRNNSESDSDDDLDSQLAKKYKKLLGEKSNKSDVMNIDKLLSEKYEKLSSELDKMKKSKKKEKKSKSKKKKYDSNSRSSSTDSKSSAQEAKCKNAGGIERSKSTKIRTDRYCERRVRECSPQPNRRSRSPIRSNRHQSNSHRGSNSWRRSRSPHQNDHNEQMLRSKNRSPIRNKRDFSADRYRNKRSDRNDRNYSSKNGLKRHNDRQRSKSRSLSKELYTRRHSRSHSKSRSNERRLPKNTKHGSRNETRSPENLKPQNGNKSDSHYADCDRDQEMLKNYGLVTASGEKIELKNDKKYTPLLAEKKATTTYVPPPPKKKLTDEEKEARLREMQKNAQWHDKEQNINRLKNEEREKLENEQEKNVKFDQNYIHKEMHKALSNQNSVEARLKSNKNNIQRMSSSMHSHFARK